MHPVSTIALILGYSLVLPVLVNFANLSGKRSRLWAAGHQIGLIVVTLGWVLRGSYFLASLHFVFLLAFALFLKLGERQKLA